MTRPLFSLAAGLVFAAAAVAQQPASPPQAESPARQSGQQPPYVFRSDVRLVTVFTTVTDEHGAPVASLKKEDFQVLEDGWPQTLAVFERESEMPLSIVLALDASISMRPAMKLELESARRFVRGLIRPVDRLSIFQFTETVDQLVDFTSDLKRIDRALNKVQLGAGTAMYDALFLASESLLDRQGRKVIVLIGDGGDTVSSATFQTSLRRAQEADAIVYSVIMVPISASAGRNTGGEHALIEISRQTGGKHYYVEDPAVLDQTFAQISGELRTQYLLGYYPPERRASTDFRKIEVRLRPAAAAGARLRHRSGYYTSRPQ